MNDIRNIIGAGVVVFQLLSQPALIAGDQDPVVDGKPVSELIKQLKNQNRGLQVRAARTLSEAPEEARAGIVPLLQPLLKSERENDRAWAAQVLGDYGPKARGAVSDILPLLEGTQFERNRAAAAKALGQILKDAPASDEIEKVTQALMKCFTDKYSDVRREAVTACGMIGPAAKSCVPLLAARYADADGLRDTECYLVRRAAGWTTGRMKEAGKVHVDSIIGLMLRNNPVATEFVDALGELGPVHDGVTANIANKLETTVYGGYQGASGEDVSNYILHALAALEKCGAKSAGTTDLLTRLLSADRIQREPALVVGVLKTLAAIGPAAEKAVPAIEGNALKSANAEVAKAAEAALAKIKAK